MNLLLFGAPGSGKGTQSQLLTKKLGLLHISTGDLFRAEIKRESEYGRELKRILAAGELVPDATTIELIRGILTKTATGFILDGFPRTLPQAEALDRLLMSTGQTLDAVIFLSVDEEKLVDRLSNRRVCQNCGQIFNLKTAPPRQANSCDNCGHTLTLREDDREEVVRHRLTKYEQATAGLKTYYKEKGIFYEIDGSQSEERVYDSIVKILEK